MLFSESCNTADTGTVAQTFANQFGCDSVVITQTLLLPPDTVFLNTVSCNPQDTGTSAQTLQNNNGCDSVVITLTTLAETYSVTNTLYSCDPEETGIATQTFDSQFGCDSIVITETLLLPTDSTLLFSGSCNPGDTGTVAQTFTNQFGCDSVVITQTALLPSDTVMLTQQSCNPQDTGITTQNLLNQFGCDSIVVTQTTLLPSFRSPVVLDLCPGDSVLFNGTYYSASRPEGLDTLTAANGCDSILDISVQLLPAPEVRFYRDTLCEGESIELFGTVYDTSQPNGQYTVPSETTGCDSVITNIALIFNAPRATLQLSAPECPGDNGHWSISSLSGGASPYTYAINGEVFEIAEGLPLRGPIAPGTYQLLVRDGLGCEGQQNFTIEATEALEIDLGADIEIRQGDEVNLMPDINFEPDSVAWSPAGSVACAGCLETTATPMASITLRLSAFKYAGCAASDEVRIQVNRRPEVYAPNAFSPNGDNQNDYFTLYANSARVAEIESLAIFDRWGAQVFEAYDLQPGLEAGSWDGRVRGTPANTGVYVFIATIRMIDGREEMIKGEFLLMK